NLELKGRLPEKSIRAIYREIMSASLALEKDLTIAYFGPEATNTHQAARSKFGASVNYTLDVFMDSELRICAQILMKIENHLVAKIAREQIRRIYSHPQVFGQC